MMTWRTAKFFKTGAAFLAMGMLLFSAVAIPAIAVAQTIDTTSPVSNTTSSGSVANCHAYVGLSNKIAGCVMDALSQAANIYFTQFYPTISEIVAAVMVIGVALYGVMIATSSVQNVGRDTIMLLIKIGIVGYCVTNSDVLYNTVTSMMNDGAQAVIQVVPSSGNADGTKDFANVTCLTNMRNASVQNGKPVMGQWLAIDCMIDTVLGIKVPNTDGSTSTDYSFANQSLSASRTGMSRGLLYFFMAGMKSSIVGLILGLIGLLYIYSLLRLMLTTLCIFLAGYMAVAFMLILSPLFIPLCLIPGEIPKVYFDKWVKMLMSFALQPVLMMVFVTLYICALDLAMFSSDYSLIYTVAGDASRQSGFDINQYISDHSAIVKKPTVLLDIKTGINQPTIQTEVNGIATAKNAYVNCGKAALLTGGTEDPNCANVQPVQFFHDALDWEALANARSPAVQMQDGAATVGGELSREVLSSAIFCAVILFVMNKFASFIPTLVSNIVGASPQPQENQKIALGNVGDPISFLASGGGGQGGGGRGS